MPIEFLSIRRLCCNGQLRVFRAIENYFTDEESETSYYKHPDVELVYNGAARNYYGF